MPDLSPPSLYSGPGSPWLTRQSLHLPLYLGTLPRPVSSTLPPSAVPDMRDSNIEETSDEAVAVEQRC